MFLIKLEGDPKKYQFSTDKFNQIYDSWNPENYEDLTMQAYLDKYLCLNKDCFYNYRHGRTGMDKDNIFAFAKLLKIPVTDLLEEKKVKENKVMTNKECMEVTTISEFSKSKIFETITSVEECIWAFFAIYDVEDEFFNLMETLRRNAVAIPDELLKEIEAFVYGELEELVCNPEALFDKVPPFSNNVEEIHKRNQALNDIQEEFMDKYYYPIQQKAKKYIIK
ncbi:MAG: hypothetical protein UEA60_09015 [Lachnospiraceae bacterium]|nr:hypothetical protein [Lachnospiraceae bacterium]